MTLTDADIQRIGRAHQAEQIAHGKRRRMLALIGQRVWWWLRHEHLTRHPRRAPKAEARPQARRPAPYWEPSHDFDPMPTRSCDRCGLEISIKARTCLYCRRRT